MKSDFDKLNSEQRAAVAMAIATSQRLGERSDVHLPDGSEAYAYPHARGSAWGLNSKSHDGYCIARGVWPEEGSHE